MSAAPSCAHTSGKYAGVDVAIPAHAQRQALRVGSPLVPTRQLLLHGCTYLCEGIPLDERACMVHV
eukprot:855135-Pelagomonas_calceolata.AAC.4